MAQTWSPSAASLESIFKVLSDHDHSFIMVGKISTTMDGGSSAYGICTYCSPSYDFLLPIADITMIVNRYPGKNLISGTYTPAVNPSKGMD